MTAKDALERLQRGEVLRIPATYLGAMQAAMEIAGGTWEVRVEVDGPPRHRVATLTPVSTPALPEPVDER